LQSHEARHDLHHPHLRLLPHGQGAARSPRYIKDLFRWYGVRLGGAINQEIHWEWLKQQPPAHRCSKYPPAFGIDLLIDDSEGVWMEGQKFGFRVVHVRPDDRNWVQPIVAEVNKSLPSPLVLGGHR